ncbi:hypothetical protein THASP1DRAFT_21925 [Thamnocephalis sphaerospora]|uniref:Uncharacterized protein n=1 Tax=Thamnocephalis sphaerospora TaxID=78915 RepID=A0A4P9XVN7_9FUNG|nr:hypothetical protein THASP1DRAFT_21925 [Thamnocephalis sphaerospora]|eukprot:RKP10345.1 hypothetical protein THASP1DRAFT_21925 [Thamnocephalis sphaerospora]
MSAPAHASASSDSRPGTFRIYAAGSASPVAKTEDDDDGGELLRSAHAHLAATRPTPSTVTAHKHHGPSTAAPAVHQASPSTMPEAQSGDEDQADAPKRRGVVRWPQEECEEMVRICTTLRQERDDMRAAASDKSGRPKLPQKGHLTVLEWREAARRLHQSGVSPVQRSWMSIYTKWTNMIDRGDLRDDNHMIRGPRRSEQPKAVKTSQAKKRGFEGYDNGVDDDDFDRVRLKRRHPMQAPSMIVREPGSSNISVVPADSRRLEAEHPRNAEDMARMVGDGGWTRDDVAMDLGGGKNLGRNDYNGTHQRGAARRRADSIAADMESTGSTLEATVHQLVLLAMEHRQDLAETQSRFRADMVALHERQREEDREREERFWNRLLTMEERRERDSAARDDRQERIWRELFDRQSELHLEAIRALANGNGMR